MVSAPVQPPRRLDRLRVVALGLAAALISSACADGGPCPQLESCDIRKRSCQREVAAIAACLRGGETAAPAVEVVDAEAFIAAEVAEAEAAEPPTPASEAFERALALLELVPVSSSVASRVRDDYENVAAFYESESDHVTVLDRGSTLDDSNYVVSLLHEFVHAMQHRDHPDLAFDSFDASLAGNALIEGEAVLYQDLASAWSLGFDPHEVDWARVFDGYESRRWNEARESNAPARLAWLHFNYAYGGAYVNQAWRAGDNPAVRGLFDAIPGSTRQVLAGYGQQLQLDSPDAEGEPVMPAGYERAGGAHLGAWLFALLRARADVDNGYPPAASYVDPGLLGDVFTVFRWPQTNDVVLSWRLRFSSESVAAMQVAGLLRQAGLRARLSGRDVFVFASTQPALLDALPAEMSWGPSPARDDQAQAPAEMALRLRIAGAGGSVFPRGCLPARALDLR